MPLFRLATLKIEGVHFRRKYENDLGIILIGGDRCDVVAERAYLDEGTEDDATVELRNVGILTTDTHAVSLAQEMFGTQAEAKKAELIDYLTNMATDAIMGTHDSIQYETFVPQRKAEWPNPPSGNVHLN